MSQWGCFNEQKNTHNTVSSRRQTQNLAEVESLCRVFAEDVSVLHRVHQLQLLVEYPSNQHTACVTALTDACATQLTARKMHSGNIGSFQQGWNILGMCYVFVAIFMLSQCDQWRHFILQCIFIISITNFYFFISISTCSCLPQVPSLHNETNCMRRFFNGFYVINQRHKTKLQHHNILPNITLHRQHAIAEKGAVSVMQILAAVVG